MNSQQRFHDKVVLITGAGRGIGKAIAQAFAAEGAKVVVQARTTLHGLAVVDAIVQQGGHAVLQTGDVGCRDDVRAMVASAIYAFGALDVVVHCAADAAIGKVVDMPEDVFANQVNANIQSLFWLSKDALPALSRSTDKGRLIFISSGEGNRSHTPGLVPYGASKAYMNAFARTLAREVGPMGVLVNVVEPGLILSDRMREHLSGLPPTVGLAEALRSSLVAFNHVEPRDAQGSGAAVEHRRDVTHRHSGMSQGVVSWPVLQGRAGFQPASGLNCLIAAAAAAVPGPRSRS